MKRLVAAGAAITLLIASALTAAAVAPTVVNHDGQFGWHTLVDAPGNSSTFVNGPGTPPLGAGSLHLVAGNGTTGGDFSAQIRNTGYAGTKLKNLTTLGYSTYMHTNNGQQFPYLSFEVATSGSGAPDDRIFFEPPYQSAGNGGAACALQPVTVMDTWQRWNALTGCWWSNSDGNPGILTYTLATYVGLHPNATIQNKTSGVGGIRLAVGYAGATDKFDGNVDAVTIGTAATIATYDFEKNLIATAISYTGDTSGVAGQAVRVSAILKESGTGLKVAGQTLTFTLQGRTCSGVTDANGSASCTITAGSAGTAAVTITYGGSTRFAAATQSASITIAGLPGLPKAGAGVVSQGDLPWVPVIALGAIATVVVLRLTLKRH